MAFTHQPIASSALISAAFDDGVLEVKFASGHVHRFHDVPHRVFDGLLKAESKGAYFHQHIKNGGYVSHRVGSVQ